jgi:hypothetical protein
MIRTGQGKAAAVALAIAMAFALAGCASLPRGVAEPVPPASTPRFDPLAFFTGDLVGKGGLKKVASARETTRVESHGRVENGVLTLVQEIHEGSKPAHTRSWTMREVSPDHYTGTLTDAQGPVTLETDGNRLHIAFTMKGGLPTEQWLTLALDGRRAYNVMKVRKLGVVVAVLVEDIRKL